MATLTPEKVHVRPRKEAAQPSSSNAPGTPATPPGPIGINVGEDDLLQAYIRDQSSTRGLLSPEEEHDLFQRLERRVRFAHSFRLKHPIALLYIERLYNKILPMPIEEAGDELSLFVRTDECRHVPEQLHAARLATFLEHATDHNIIRRQAQECIAALNEARRTNSHSLPDLKAQYLKVLSRSAEAIRELALVPGHFVAISQFARSHFTETCNDRNAWEDTELAQLDPRLGLTQHELGRRLATLERAENDVEALRKTAIEANLRLAVMIALRYRNKGLELIDLIQEANLGLIKAVDRFDHRLGTRFSSYAVHWIQQAIKKALLEKARPIRLPEGKVELLVALSRTTAQLTQKLHREPNVDELAGELGMSSRVISHLLQVAASPLSLQRPYLMDNSEELDLREAIEDSNVVFPWEIVDRRYLKDLLPDLLKVLPERDRKIIELRYGIGTADGKPMTLAEIARLVYKGVKVVHRRQIESIRKRQIRALKKLQHPSRIKHLM